jgi:hypothetical protein
VIVEAFQVPVVTVPKVVMLVVPLDEGSVVQVMALPTPPWEVST